MIKVVGNFPYCLDKGLQRRGMVRGGDFIKFGYVIPKYFTQKKLGYIDVAIQYAWLANFLFYRIALLYCFMIFPLCVLGSDLTLG